MQYKFIYSLQSFDRLSKSTTSVPEGSLRVHADDQFNVVTKAALNLNSASVIQ